MVSLMKKDNKWMLMTYYCPTHGDTSRIEPVEIARDEISQKLLRHQQNQSKPNESQ